MRTISSCNLYTVRLTITDKHNKIFNSKHLEQLVINIEEIGAVDLEEVGFGPTIILPSVHSMLHKLLIDHEGVGVGLTLALPSEHGIGVSNVRKLVAPACYSTVSCKV